MDQPERLWDYAVTDSDASGRAIHRKNPGTVPDRVGLVGRQETADRRQRLWYRRPSRTATERRPAALAALGAVDWEAVVWVNGQEIGTHRGGYDSFSFDITSPSARAENQLLVGVRDTSGHHGEPRGKQEFSAIRTRGHHVHAVLGIWQTVWLETVPEASIAALTLTPD